MATTPRRRRKAADVAAPAPAPALPLTAADLAEFMGGPEAKDLDEEALALGQARELVAVAAGHELPEQLPHNLRQAVLLTAARVLLTGDATAAAIPLTARYYLATHAAARAV
jgi:hypothetical protein